MDFNRALEAMKEGQKVRRVGMARGDYITFQLSLGSGKPMHKEPQYFKDGLDHWVYYKFSCQDVESNDWEILCGTPDVSLPIKNMKRLKDGWEPLDIIFPSLRINTTLPPGTVYIKNSYTPLSGQPFFEIDPTTQAINEFKEWLGFMVISSETHINNSINNKRYSEVSDYAIELDVYKQCLAKLDKMLV
jgi:hypothetical protein